MLNPDQPDPPPQDPAQTRSDSENRKRSAPVHVRYFPEELAELQASAEAAGLSVAGFIRARTLARPVARAWRAPSVLAVALIALKTELNRVGGHLYQLMRHMNFGGLPEAGEANAAYKDYLLTSASIRTAIDRERGQP